MNIKIISAGAGSGKTYRLTEEMVALLKGGIRANGIIATTFTNKAAAELQERVRIRLLEEGMPDKANDLTNALIGTVHGLGVKLLKRFAFEAGVSPEVDIIAEEDQQTLFNDSLTTILTHERLEAIQHSSERLGLTGEEADRWRRMVKDLTDVARSNDFSTEVLEKSKQLSFGSLQPFLGKPAELTSKQFNERLLHLLETTLAHLDSNSDDTRTTLKAKNTLKNILNTLQLKGHLNWEDWVRISKIKVAVKSRDAIEELTSWAARHDEHPAFHSDLQQFIYHLFDIAIAALSEYDRYKKQRGLIDYIDMESLVNKLLDHPDVKPVLQSEIDLLLVDEFQDTSPIQLEIFLKLSRMVRHSIWVGDPKQSIYGFRGADPALMQEIILKCGIEKENILMHSWRSREDIVHLTNSLFTKAFPDLPTEQVALYPKRTKADNPSDERFKAEPIDLQDAIQHWHFEHGEGRLPGRPWMENCLADSVKRLLLDRQVPVLPKGEKNIRSIQPGDIAVLCRSNRACQEVARALHRAGLKAAIARSGLLETAEAKLTLACLKFILHRSDSLSIAEILLLTGELSTEEIIEDRLQYLEEVGEQSAWDEKWASHRVYIDQLHQLREQVGDLSGAEILHLVLEELDLRRIIATWGKTEQRMANLDMLRRYALQYEEACTRLHIAASLGGFLLWLYDIAAKSRDAQGSGESPDAINVLTYHKSKGLEWPAVICYDLEGTLREKTFGLRLMSDTDQVDLDNLLGNRWLRFWVNPYGKQSRNTALEQRLQASDAFAVARKEALAEETRLLYVGITRARDYLIFPTRNSPTRWLNRVWHNGKEDHFALDHHESETPWEWNGEVIHKNTEVEAFPRDFVHSEKSVSTTLYLNERQGTRWHPVHQIDWKEGVPKTIKYGAPTAFAKMEEVAANDQGSFAQLLKAVLLSDAPNLDVAYRDDMLAALVERFGLSEVVEVPALKAYSAAFYDALRQPVNVIKQYPFRYHQQGRSLEGVVDLVVKGSGSLILIQFDLAAAEKLPRKPSKTAALLYHAGHALSRDFDTPVSGLVICQVLYGKMTPLKGVNQQQEIVFPHQ